MNKYLECHYENQIIKKDQEIQKLNCELKKMTESYENCFSKFLANQKEKEELIKTLQARSK